MVDLLVYAALAALLLAGLAALSRPRAISDEEYAALKGKGSLVGNAMHALHDVLAPQRAEALRKAKTEILDEDPSGDPPPDEPPAGIPRQPPAS
jgi:hypothetical protein